MKKLVTIFCALLFGNLLFCFPNNNSMNSKVNSVPKEISEAAFKDPKKNFEPLVRNLMSGSKDSSTIVRIFHDWICNNIAYDTDLFFSGRISGQDYVSVMKKKKAVCSGYSQLFLEMCRIAGIEARGIHGYSKGFGYTGKIGPKTDHEWNCVKIGNNWKLLDCCWDAGYVEGKTFVKHYSLEWYFLSPEKMLYSHLPENDEDQFVSSDKIKTKEQFVKEPYIAGKFFSYGFELLKEIPDYTTAISEEKSFEFKIVKSGVQTSAVLYRKKDNSPVENFLWVDRKGSVYTYTVDVPDKELYKAVIFAKNSANLNYSDFFSIQEFEQSILPSAEALIAPTAIAGKSITQADFELFKEGFFKSEENGRYYYKEDLFNSKQINVIKNVFKILNVESGCLEQVLYFDVTADESYAGAGVADKYPSVYSSYNTTVNTTLVSPKCKNLKSGEVVLFEFESKDYTNIALTFGNELIPFTKEISIYKKEIEIPDNCENVVIFGSKNGRNYEGLISYDVE